MNSKAHITELRQELDLVSSKITPNFRKMSELKLELEKSFREEEIFWKEQSKFSWMRDGDNNMSFFHGSVQTRKMRNKISYLVNGNGVEQFDEDAKGKIVVDYFSILFQTSQPDNDDELLEGFEAKVTPAMNRDLIKPVTETGIHRAVKAIKGDSAPGINGMTGKNFQKFWAVTGQQVTLEVKKFFHIGWFPQDWNHTQLFLLPKKLNPNMMTDLRSISLCLVPYKIVSKILCTRLKKILPKIVSPTQGAFVAGQLISDNLLIAHEMVHELRTNSNCKQDFIAIKMDMSKAYGRVEWNFLEVLFQRMGFDQRWITRIMVCIRSVSYSVLLNGQTHGYITPEREIR